MLKTFALTVMIALAAAVIVDCILFRRLLSPRDPFRYRCIRHFGLALGIAGAPLLALWLPLEWEAAAPHVLSIGIAVTVCGMVAELFVWRLKKAVGGKLIGSP